jgi:putative ABC transport system permease protein
MKFALYPKLALTGISKNRKIYLPYILTCVGMTMMFYIICFLSASKSVADMPGGASMQTILSLGTGVIGFFALVFLFYTNSFLIRKRKKEFGLYNILGMGKKNIARILIWETLFIAVISLVCGLFCGILFSKAAELMMARMLGAAVDFSFTVGVGCILQTLVLFSVIFLFILLHALRQIHLAKPVELLHSDSVGEKAPRSNWVLALLGALILAGAYGLALSVKQPLAAIMWFFVAVIMVIVATYLLFVAGSVVLCRLLQKSKRYYYKPNHFVSVSSMVYRMKRNGAGLASICILSTMVLVMLSSTVCLYIGTEGSLRNRYPRNIVLDLYSAEASYSSVVDDAVDDALQARHLQAENALRYRYLDLSGYTQGEKAIFDRSALSAAQQADYTNARQFFFVPLEDYNRLMGTQETLAPNQVLLYCTKSDYTYDLIQLEGLGAMQVKKLLPEFVDNGIDAMQIIPSTYVIVPDFAMVETVYEQQLVYNGENHASSIHYYYGFDLSADDQTQIALQSDIQQRLSQVQANDDDFPTTRLESAAQNRSDFYALYGGLFFLGVLLGIVFILGAVLIMYYKQISEGYEDQERFAIMQKVGMTKKEIRKSVNSQVLTVFFLPLVVAGIHVAFAFPMISKLLALFNLTNIRLLVVVTICCYLLFALFYILVYWITSRTYYGIVSNLDES